MKVRLIVNGQPQELIDVTDDSIVGTLLAGRDSAACRVLAEMAEMVAEIKQIGGADVGIEIKGKLPA